MKKLILSALILASVAITFSSCSNGVYNATPGSNTGVPNPIYQQINTILTTNNANTSWGNNGSGNGNTGNSQFLTCSIDGTSFVSTTQQALLQTAPLGMFIYGEILTDASHYTMIGLSLSNYTGPGTYTTTGGNFGYYTLANPPTLTQDDSHTDGQIIITSDGGVGGYIKGTFQFSTIVTNKQITNGQFSIKISN